MLIKQWIAAVLVMALAFTIVACQTPEAPDAASDSADAAGAGANAVLKDYTPAPWPGVNPGVGQDESAVDQESAADTSDSEQAQPMVQSGQATLPAATPIEEKERPQPEQGIQRVVSLSQAIDAVDFEVMQLSDLPEAAKMQIVQLVEPADGQPSDTLPAVRLIYDIDGLGVIVLLQSPATGEPADGDETTIAGVPGWVQATDDLTILTWENGPVRYELRGSGIDTETLQRAAASLGPSGP